jgi:hypothetical protein
MDPSLKDSVEFGANISQILTSTWPVLLAAFAVLGLAIFVIKKNWRISKNISRPMAIIALGDEMSSEYRLLQKSGYFKRAESRAFDDRAADDITSEYALVVLRYHKGNDTFWHLYEKLASSGAWIIIYSEPAEIPVDDLKRIQKYAYYSLCNTPVRLLSDIWATMAVKPEGK